MRFLRERIRLTEKAKVEVKNHAESIAQSITSALSTNDVPTGCLEQIETNTQQFTKDISRHLKTFSKKQLAISPNY